MTVAGGALEQEDEMFYIDYCENNDLKFFIMYGQTEATARISVRERNRLRQSIGTIGNPVPGGKLWIEYKDENLCDKNKKVGEVIYSGKNVAMGYAENYSDLIKGYEWNGILHTRDIGYFDEDGNIHLLGRSDRVVKVGGIRVNLSDIEKMLKEKYSVGRYECIQIKSMDGKWNTKIQIKMYDTFEQEQEVLKFLEEKLGISKRWFYVG